MKRADILTARAEDMGAIEWKIYRPLTFPCMTGCGREATRRVLLEVGTARVTICVCRECAALSPGVLAGLFFDCGIA